MTSRSAADEPAASPQWGAGPFRTAIVPAAGLGTRFLPATKTVPKELLPVVDTPGIELVAGEAAEAGARRLIIITNEGKDGVVAHFRSDPELEATLAERGKTDLLAKVRRAPELIDVEAVVQPSPHGLGHAIGCAEPALAADEDAVAVLLPDDLVLPTGVLEQMAAVRREHGGSVLCAFEVPEDQVSAYGVFAVEPAGSADGDVQRVTGMVEKPAPQDAPSSLAAAGRYILDRAVFDALRRIEPGARRGTPDHRRHRVAHRRGAPGARGGAPRPPPRPGQPRRVCARGRRFRAAVRRIRGGAADLAAGIPRRAAGGRARVNARRIRIGRRCRRRVRP
ncbi:hypothetical protein GCM10023353_14240 [Tomitella cavernea]|uniref:UTP--glucose-1-phosphate uridylyltransferase n=1 Tax=Tomitella cavernea TaxID=1387982 RepID=A0ABP9CHF1_9ACTN